MSESSILFSLKLVAKTNIEEIPGLEEDTVFLLRRDIFHMRTLSEVLLFISSFEMDINTPNLQEDFDAEQRAAAKSSILLPTGPAAIGTSRKPDVTAAGALKEIS